MVAGERACRKCGQLLKWASADQGQGGDNKQADSSEKQGTKRSWLWPLLALILVIAMAAGGIYVLMRMAEKPPAAPVVENATPEADQDAVIPDARAPIISKISVDKISYNSVEIKWTTDEPSSSQVIWRTSEGKISVTDEKEALVDQHVVELTDMKNKQRYYFKVRSVDEAYNVAISDEDSFDIGLSQGVVDISVADGGMKTEEPQPSVFRTVISGKVVNSGEVPVRTKDIEVWINITVAGKAGVTEVKADLDPTPDILNPLYEIGFRAVVPDRTNPDYIITSKIVDQQD